MLRRQVPQNTKEMAWTRHAVEKMMFYRLSDGRVRRVIKSPTRREEGIATGTIAVMQRNDTNRRREEIWVMFADKGQNKLKNIRAKRVIISAWRYPGTSPKGKEIPIPQDIREYLDIF